MCLWVLIPIVAAQLSVGSGPVRSYICTVHSPTPAPSYSVWVLFKPVDILVPVEAVRHISEQFLPAR